MGEDPHEAVARRIEDRTGRLEAYARDMQSQDVEGQLADLQAAVKADAELARMKLAQADAPLTD